MSENGMRLTINGDERELAEGMTVADLLAQLELDPSSLAVERNQELVPRSEHATTSLYEGDTLEVVTLVGGG